MSAHVVNEAGALERLQEKMLRQQCSRSNNCNEQKFRTTLAATVMTIFDPETDAFLKIAGVRIFWSPDSSDNAPTISVQLLLILVGHDLDSGS